MVRQLELEDRGTVLERWLAHHLADVISRADQAADASKGASEAQAVDIILKIWAHRRALPEPVDPLGGYRRAVEMLGRLVPDASPWAHVRQPQSYDGLLHEMFQLLSRIVLAGLALTQISRRRSVTAEEFQFLEEEEKHLISAFDQWVPLVPGLQSRLATKMENFHADTAEDAESDDHSRRHDGSDGQTRIPDEQATSADVQFHAAIASNLEQMQSALARLLTRWRESQPCNRDGEGENGVVPDEGREAMMTESRNQSGRRETVPEETGTEMTDSNSLRSDRGDSFWSSPSLAELAEAQGVSPVEDLDSLAALWPLDDNPEEMLTYVLLERAARRRAVQGDAPR